MIYYWRRIGAFFIDSSVISMLLSIVFAVAGPLVALTNTDIVIDLFKMVLFFIISIFVAVGYNVFCYSFFKYPLGKLLMRVLVLDENSERVSTKRYFIRELNKYTYIYATLGVYLPFQFLKNVASEKQVLHDKKSDTHIFM